jgi:hypothetical protein
MNLSSLRLCVRFLHLHSAMTNLVRKTRFSQDFVATGFQPVSLDRRSQAGSLCYVKGVVNSAIWVAGIARAEQPRIFALPFSLLF